MKIPFLAVLAAVCCVLLSGAAVKAPVLPTKGFYVNDYAELLTDVHRDSLYTLSAGLYDSTGVQLVLLSVNSLGGMDMDEYIEGVVRGWGIGGQDGADGVLIFIRADERSCVVYTGENLAYLDEYRDAGINLGGGSPSAAIMDACRRIVSAVYAERGVQPDQHTRELLDKPAANNSPFGAGTVIFVSMMALVVARSYRVSRKYRAKYLKGHVRKRKTYARSYDDEAQYNNKSIYRNDYDDFD